MKENVSGFFSEHSVYVAITLANNLDCHEILRQH